MPSEFVQTMLRLREEAEKRTEAVSEKLCGILKSDFTDKNELDAPTVLANCIEVFDIGDPKDAGQLYLEWTVEKYVGKKAAANIPDVLAIVDALEEAGYTEENPYVFNDMDDCLFYVPCRGFRIFCEESQNTRYVYVYDEKMGNLHIRRYYDEYQPPEHYDTYQIEKDEKFKTEGVLEAIARSDWLCETVSDCLPGVKYPSRPSLKFFKDRSFKFEYHDCRDIGYVASYDVLRGSVDRAIFHFIDIRMAFFYLRVAASEIKEFSGH